MTIPVPRDAATVVIVRDAPRPRAGIEVLLLQRAEGGDHNSGAWAFPGGLVDSGDRVGFELPLSLNDHDASRWLGLKFGGLAWFLAAIRESFEEAGILFAVDPDGGYAFTTPESQSVTSRLRRDLRRGKCSLARNLPPVFASSDTGALDLHLPLAYPAGPDEAIRHALFL